MCTIVTYCVVSGTTTWYMFVKINLISAGLDAMQPSARKKNMASTTSNFTKPCRRCQSMVHVRQSACKNCGLVFFAKKSSRKFRMREIRARRKEKPSEKLLSLGSPNRSGPSCPVSDG